MFLVAVEKRDEATLTSILGQWVFPNTVILSGCWKAFDSLPDKTFLCHFTEDHSVNFGDPDTGAHTNTIEDVEGCAVDDTYIRFRKAHFAGYLAEYQFKRRVERDNRLHHFYRAAASHPPKPLE